jgi:uncharacterized membrane protein YjdF
VVHQAIASAPAARPSPVFLVVGGIATVIFLAISLLPREGPVGYDYSFLFLVPLLWMPYLLRARLDLSPLHFGLFALALLLHDLGAYGCYYQRYLGLQFDYYVHFFFGMVAALILARALERRFHPGRVELALLVILVVTGLGGLHEIMEAGSTLILGKNGMYVPQAEPYDTQSDLLNTVLGSLTAVFLRLLAARRRARGIPPNVSGR